MDKSEFSVKADCDITGRSQSDFFSEQLTESIGQALDQLAINSKKSVNIPLAEEVQITKAQIKNKEREDTLDLKKKYANRLMIVMCIQLLIMNVVFVLVGFGYMRFTELTLNIYVTGTLIELFGLIYVITRSLFPGQKNGLKSKEKE